MTQAVIGTVSEMDAPMNPAAKALRALSIYLTGQTAEQLQKERDQVLDATAEDIRALAGHMKAFLEDDCLCVVGNTKKIEEEKERFGTLDSCFEARGCPDKSSVQSMEHIHNGKLRREGFSC